VRFWQRQVLWRGGGNHGRFPFSAFDHRLISARPDTQLGDGSPIRLDHPALAASRGRPDVEAFLFWSRMPIVFEEGGRAYLADQRFNSSLTRRSFVVPLDKPSQ
jgi:inner membrane protein